jgi:hypothetical protein
MRKESHHPLVNFTGLIVPICAIRERINGSIGILDPITLEVVRQVSHAKIQITDTGSDLLQDHFMA